MKPLAFAAAFLLPIAIVGSQLHLRATNSYDSETTRIRTRLAAVEQQLRQTDVSRLTSAQRAARARNLDVLHEYWVRAVFPKNTDFPGQMVPYFVDRYGTRCVFALAVAIFTLASVLCGLSINVPMLVAARILQGLGAAMMTPLAVWRSSALFPNRNC